ncbi:MAG: hypothetical protein AAB583_00925, partial [Patescibacteria group bacterium]
MKYEILNGLPSSHAWKKVDIYGKTYKGIIWDEKNIKRDDTLLLYKDWATVFFDSDWYEIGTGSISEEDSTERDVHLLKDIFRGNLKRDKTLIDVHCGSGRHLLKLAEDEIYGIGMEGAEPLRDQAKQKIRDRNVPI